MHFYGSALVNDGLSIFKTLHKPILIKEITTGSLSAVSAACHKKPLIPSVNGVELLYRSI